MTHISSSRRLPAPRCLMLSDEMRVVITPAENTWRLPRSARRKLRIVRHRLFQGVRDRWKGRNPRCSLLTLTVNPNERTPEEAYEAMRAAWNVLAGWFRENHPSMGFFRVVEQHESGYPHFHVLLIAAPFIAQKNLSLKWASLLGQGVAVVDIRAVRNLEHAVRYVTKYLLKNAEQVADAPWWNSRVRPYAASRGLLATRHAPARWWKYVEMVPSTSRELYERTVEHGLMTPEEVNHDKEVYVLRL